MTAAEKLNSYGRLSAWAPPRPGEEIALFPSSCTSEKRPTGDDLYEVLNRGVEDCEAALKVLHQYDTLGLKGALSDDRQQQVMAWLKLLEGVLVERVGERPHASVPMPAPAAAPPTDGSASGKRSVEPQLGRCATPCPQSHC